MKHEIYIGIDCGVNTGFALWNKKLQKFERVETMQIHRALQEVFILHKQNIVNPIFIRVEDARKRKWFGKNSAAKLQGSGSIKREIGRAHV